MKPNNILLILCDQLSAGALRAYGNTYSQTPGIDSICQNGTSFLHTYTACPLCQPSRAAFWTSRYPHQTNVRSNLVRPEFPVISDSIPTMGEYFSMAGYDCVHFGKTHDYGSLRGFRIAPSVLKEAERSNPAIPFDYETYMDIDTTEQIRHYLEERGQSDESGQSGSAPFLAVADLQNPHNICEYIGEHEHGVGEFALTRPLPPLPENYSFEDIENRPGIIKYMCCAHRRQRQTCSWEALDYQYYLYAYYYYLEMVDHQIETILQTLKEQKLDENTLVVFFSDHGEGMAAHQLVTKYASFYEETNHVPFCFSGPGIKRCAGINGVSSLLDLLPTLLDYAGLLGRGEYFGNDGKMLPRPAHASDEEYGHFEGVSLLPQLTGESPVTGQPFISAEWHDEFAGYTIPGRMICDGKYKYIQYLEKDSEELYDMKKDPLEMRNLAVLPSSAPVLCRYRQKLDEHIRQTGDDFYSLQADDSSVYRSHPVGRKYHEGPSAVEIYHAGKAASYAIGSQNRRKK